MRNRYGGSNSTRLTGIVQEIFPNIISSLYQGLQFGFKKLEFHKGQAFGIRSWEYLEFSKEGLAQYLEELKALRLEKEKNKAVFVIRGNDEVGAVKANEEKDTQKEKKKLGEELKALLQGHSSNLYHVICLFSDRSQFVGGEVFIDIEEKASGEGAEEYDDEEATPALSNVAMKNYDDPVVERVALEKGSALILDGARKFAVERTIIGQRFGLLIELWPFKDAPITSQVLSVEEGGALGLAESVKGEF